MELHRGGVVAGVVGAVGVVVAAVWWWRYRDTTRSTHVRTRLRKDELGGLSWRRVGRVSGVCVYPIKSCAGVPTNTALATPLGLTADNVRDRSFMLLGEKGNMITGRMIPATVLIKPTVEEDKITLEFPGKDKITLDLSKVEEQEIRKDAKVWDDTVPGLDCGEEVAGWLQDALGKKCRLLYHATIPSPRTTDLGDKYPLLLPDDNALYADLTGYMLMTKESVEDLEQRVQQSECSIHPENFRYNILVEGTSRPYDEDNWRYLKIGDVIFRNVKPCSRCIFTTIDYSTGKKDKNMEPLRTLKKYRCPVDDDSPHLGINLGLDIPGTISQGMEVYATFM